MKLRIECEDAKEKEKVVVVKVREASDNVVAIDIGGRIGCVYVDGDDGEVRVYKDDIKGAGFKAVVK